jgi:hypothetical protein
VHKDRLAEAHQLERDKGLTRHQIDEVKIFVVQCAPKRPL